MKLRLGRELKGNLLRYRSKISEVYTYKPTLITVETSEGKGKSDLYDSDDNEKPGLIIGIDNLSRFNLHFLTVKQNQFDITSSLWSVSFEAQPSPLGQTISYCDSGSDLLSMHQTRELERPSIEDLNSQKQDWSVHVEAQSIEGISLRAHPHENFLVDDREKAFLQIGLRSKDRDVTRLLELKDRDRHFSKEDVVTYRYANWCNL
uniref:Pep3_Vps18 domain-containing protein n=1 Tax=Syphacia muris TaxID=451379 RepID=A0A0N5B1M3_9BILA